MDQDLFKIIIEEIRESSKKVDNLRDSVNTKFDSIESKIDVLNVNIHQVERECGRLETAQAVAGQEHGRMNDLLEEHIRRTNLAESRIELLEDDLTERTIIARQESKREASSISKIKKISIYAGIISALGGLIITALKSFNLI